MLNLVVKWLPVYFKINTNNSMKDRQTDGKQTAVDLKVVDILYCHHSLSATVR